MQIKRQILVFDAADIAAESAFWAGLLDGIVHGDEDWHAIEIGGEYRMAVQLAPNHVQPDWPDGTPQQIHIDLHVDNIDDAHERVLALGARLLQPSQDPTGDDRFNVYADPAGHPFCLCW